MGNSLVSSRIITLIKTKYNLPRLNWPLVNKLSPPVGRKIIPVTQITSLIPYNMGRVQRVKAPPASSTSKSKPETANESNEEGDSDAVEMAVDIKKPSTTKGNKKKTNGVEEKLKSTRGRKKADPQEDEEAEEELAEAPEPPKASTRGRKKAPVTEDAPEDPEPKKSSRGKKKDSPKEEELDEEPPKKVSRGRKKAETAENGGDAEVEGEEKAKASRGRKKAPTPEPSSSDLTEKKTRGRKKNPPKEESSDNEEEEKLPTRGKKAKLDEIKEGTPEDDDEEVEEKKIPDKLPAKRARKPVKAPVEEEDDEEEEKPVAKRGRKPAEKKAKEPKDSKELKETKETKEKATKAKRDDAVDEGDDPPAKKTKGDDKKPMNKVDTNLDEIDFTCDKENAKGDKANFKICCWNVGGIRSVVGKKGVDYCLKEDADIIVMQETKCNEKDLPEELKLDGYKRYYMGSDKSGYAGVALYTKKEPIDVKIGLESSPCNDEGRIITAEYDGFYVINVYVPNAGTGLKNMPRRLEWNEAFKKYVKELDDKKPVIICGDMNVSHQEIDLANPKTNVKHAGFTKEEREGMDELLEGGFVDTFRQLYPDKTGAYTFWTYLREARSKNLGWRLDYFIVSERIKDNICDNVMRNNVFGSDHCPIVLFANF